MNNKSLPNSDKIPSSAEINIPTKAIYQVFPSHESERPSFGSYWATRLSRIKNECAEIHYSIISQYEHFDNNNLTTSSYVKPKYKLKKYRKLRLFRGLSFFINGMTNQTPPQCPTNEIYKKIFDHSGQIHIYFSDTTDIIIADDSSRATKEKYSRGAYKNVKVLKSIWIIDCIKQGQLIDVTLKKNARYNTFSETISIADVTNPYQMIMAKRVAESRAKSSASLAQPSYKKPKIETDQTKFTNHQTITKFDSYMKIKKLDWLKLVPLSGLPKSFIDFNPESRENIVQEFFEKSRLSKISGFRNEFCNYLVEKSDGNGDDKKGGQIRLLKNEEITHVLHIDMDCFFVSIARKNRPDLIGKPVAVCHAVKNSTIPDPNSKNSTSLSEISSCSYEARKFGIRANMHLGTALKRCPDLITCTYDFNESQKVAKQMYDLAIERFGYNNIEAVSCDEIYVNVKLLSNHILEKAIRSFRKAVFNLTGCSCSIGAGQNKVLARCATKAAKPDGYKILSELEDCKKFMEELKFSDLPGIGPVFVRNIVNFYQNKKSPSITLSDDFTCGQLRQITSYKQDLFAIYGNELANKLVKYLECTYKGYAEPSISAERKNSISLNMFYAIRLRHYHHLIIILYQILSELVSRATKIKAFKCENIMMEIAYRRGNADMEPIKYGGMGYSHSVKFTIILNDKKKNQTLFKRKKSSEKVIRFSNSDDENCKENFIYHVLVEAIKRILIDPDFEKYGTRLVDFRGFGFKMNNLEYLLDK